MFDSEQACYETEHQTVRILGCFLETRLKTGWSPCKNYEREIRKGATLMLKTVRLRRINVWQASKIAAIIYFLLFAVIFLPIGLFMSVLPTADIGDEVGVWQSFGKIFFFVAPFLYAFFGFVFTAIACAVFNLVAGWTGGIEVQTQTTVTDPDMYQ